MVVEPLGVGVGEPCEATHVHANSQVLTLDERRLSPAPTGAALARASFCDADVVEAPDLMVCARW